MAVAQTRRIKGKVHKEQQMNVALQKHEPIWPSKVGKDATKKKKKAFHFGNLLYFF